MKYVYLDNNSTTQTDKEVVDAMVEFYNESYGNPSSFHSIGQKNREVVESSRKKISELLHINYSELVFTSCGTESNNVAIKGIAYAYKEKGRHIITSKTEHPSVLNVCKALEKDGFEVTFLDVDENGYISIECLKEELREDTILVSIMHGNNEIGTIQDIESIGEIVANSNAFFHVDAVQTVGKIPVEIKKWKIDLLSFSGHKFYGPKGIGGLYIRGGIRLKKLMDGGHQERNRRPGTENIAGIVGMTRALEISMENMDKLYHQEKELRDFLQQELYKKIPEIRINAEKANRLPGTLSITIKYVEGESILLNLDNAEIACSSGSACSSDDLEPSYVILAIGVPISEAHGTIRFGIGKHNTKEDMDLVIEKLPEIIGKLRKMSPLWEGE